MFYCCWWCLDIAGIEKFEHSDKKISSQDTLANGDWQKVSDEVNRSGIYLSKIDLETDLVEELGASILDALDKKITKAQ